MEPVNVGAVYYGGKLPPSLPEDTSNRGETENHLQQSPHFLDEELPAVVPAVRDSGPLHFISDLADDVINLIISEQVRDLPGSEQIIDQN